MKFQNLISIYYSIIQQVNIEKNKSKIVVNLISDNRSQQSKLVGRIKLDISQFMKKGAKSEVSIKQLQNCSLKKPQVAKIEYELNLVKEQQLDIYTANNKQQIVKQLDKALFNDGNQYNQFYKKVSGESVIISGISGSSFILNKSKQDDIIPIQTDKSIKQQSSLQIKNVQKPDTELPNLQNLQNIPIRSNQQQNLIQNNQNLKNSVKQLKTSLKTINLDRKQSKGSKGSQSPRKKATLQKIENSQSQTFKTAQQQKKYYLSVIEQQEEYIQSLQNQLTDANEILDQYQTEINLFKEESQRLQLERANFIQSQSLLKDQIIKLQEELRLTEQALTKQNLPADPTPLISQNQEQLEEYKLKFKQLQEKLSEYRMIVTEKEEIIEQKSKSIEHLEAEFHKSEMALKHKLSQKDQQYLYLQSEFEAIKTIENDLSLKLSLKQQENFGLMSNIQILKHQLQGLQNNIKEAGIQGLHQTIDQNTKVIIQLEENLSRQTTTVKNLQSTISNLQKQIGSKKKFIDGYSNELNIKNESIERLKLKVEKAEHQLLKYTEKYKMIEKQKYLLSEQVNSFKLDQKLGNRSIDQQLKKVKQDLIRSELAHEQSQNKITELKLAIQSYQQTLKQQQKKGKLQVEELSTKLQKFNKKELLLRQTLDLFENESNKIKLYMSQKQLQLKQWTNRLISKQSQLGQIQQKARYYQRKHRMAENQIQQLKIELKLTQSMLPLDDEENIGEAEVQSRLSALTEANKQLLQKQRSTGEQLAAKNVELTSLQRQLTEFESLKQSLKLSQQKVAMLEKKQSELKVQLQQSRNKYSQMKQSSNSQSKSMNKLVKECQKLQDQIRSLQQQKYIISVQNLERQDEINRLMIENHRQQQQLNNFQQQLIAVQKINSQNEAQIQDLLQKINILQSSNKPKIHIGLDSKIQPRLDHMQSPIARSKQQQQVYRLKEQIQKYKCSHEQYLCQVLDLQGKLDQVKKERETLETQKGNKSNSYTKDQKKNLMYTCQQLESLIEQRMKNRQSESMLQLLMINSQMANSDRLDQVMLSQKNAMQQQSRKLSLCIQKLKTSIFKKISINYKEKAQLIEEFKSCESITNELVKIVENLANEVEDLEE